MWSTQGAGDGPAGKFQPYALQIQQRVGLHSSSRGYDVPRAFGTATGQSCASGTPPVDSLLTASSSVPVLRHVTGGGGCAHDLHHALALAPATSAAPQWSPPTAPQSYSPCLPGLLISPPSYAASRVHGGASAPGLAPVRGGVPAMLHGGSVHAQPGPSVAGPAPPHGLPRPPPPMVLEAMMGYICSVFALDAIDFWMAGSGVQPVFVQSYAPDVALLNNLGGVRRPGAGSTSDDIMGLVIQTRAPSFFGGTRAQSDILERTGARIRSIVGVPCPATSGAWDASGAQTAAPSGTVAGVLLLYSAQGVPQTPQIKRFLGVLGSAFSAAGKVVPASEAALPSTAYELHPKAAYESGVGWLLLAAARALNADVAEQWAASLDPARVMMSAERLLVEASVDRRKVSFITGEGSEPAHPLSSQICHAAFFAGTIVWYNSRHYEVLGCSLGLPIQTAIGVPIRFSGSSRARVFLLYSLRRILQSESTTTLLAHLQPLVSLSSSLLDEVSFDGSSTAGGTPSTLSAMPSPTSHAEWDAAMANAGDSAGRTRVSPYASSPSDQAWLTGAHPATPVLGRGGSHGEPLRSCGRRPVSGQKIARRRLSCPAAARGGGDGSPTELKLARRNLKSAIAKSSSPMIWQQSSDGVEGALQRLHVSPEIFRCAFPTEYSSPDCGDASGSGGTACPDTLLWDEFSAAQVLDLFDGTLLMDEGAMAAGALLFSDAPEVQQDAAREVAGSFPHTSMAASENNLVNEIAV